MKYLNDSLVALRNSFNSKEILKNRNLHKIINIVEKILSFNKQQKGRGLKKNNS